ncbi:MAG: hypothetical protein US86_C0001G0320 [Candidatus Daviesbacteria bacterium GW2011_GWA2_38_24]|uniref:Uncharacterized protein n=1 Tax=Candidatus Daviesbacteria bacterium GW2011_GWA2_38_24 TaxID=1618422 RepID=A0A0G0JI59_9BACT|nr:MAG: hypothetical protein US86_C0001G0320 [Candidatus Daviesbacteria bacterium GW2011_GWA2_38_24]KKQ80192.1 MAG: hypothetical protein UT01_C0017G0005 [Candidatus Daviesbacteria bacterium GW2011_GWA1_38_7]OGE23530.1 MAG: hypothetical protein A2688_03085 [Candidatus Daviesbacteria bacterium RIFCSPHIGHO2_01_FULL_38_8]
MSKPKVDRKLNIPLEVVKELLTESEWRMVEQRALIISFLGEGLSIRNIASKLGVGTDTVMRVSKKFRASEALKAFFKKPKVSSSKWIFGQVSEEEE